MAKQKPAQLYRDKPIQPNLDLRHMYHYARKACRRAGYPTWDSEFDSAINEATYRAAQEWSPLEDRGKGKDGREKKGKSPNQLATFYALRLCKLVRKNLRKWHKTDQANQQELMQRWKKNPKDLPALPLSDFEILSFVALHGITKAATLLGMARSRLREVLDDISQRLHELLT